MEPRLTNIELQKYHQSNGFHLDIYKSAALTVKNQKEISGLIVSFMKEMASPHTCDNSEKYKQLEIKFDTKAKDKMLKRLTSRLVTFQMLEACDDLKTIQFVQKLFKEALEFSSNSKDSQNQLPPNEIENMKLFLSVNHALLTEEAIDILEKSEFWKRNLADLASYNEVLKHFYPKISHYINPQTIDEAIVFLKKVYDQIITNSKVEPHLQELQEKAEMVFRTYSRFTLPEKSSDYPNYSFPFNFEIIKTVFKDFVELASSKENYLSDLKNDVNKKEFNRLIKERSNLTVTEQKKIADPELSDIALEMAHVKTSDNGASVVLQYLLILAHLFHSNQIEGIEKVIDVPTADILIAAMEVLTINSKFRNGKVDAFVRQYLQQEIVPSLKAG